MPTEVSIYVSDTRVTATSVQHTEIWMHSRTVLPPELPGAGGRMWQTIGRDLAVEAARSLGPVIAPLAAAGVAAVARRARRAALAWPAPGLPGRARGELPPVRQALPPGAPGAPARQGG